MVLSNTEIFITIAMMALGTAVTRFLPFLCFPANKETPKFVRYLGKVLPYSVMGLLLIYCLKDVSVIAAPFALPEAVSIAAITALHLWKRNTLLSIGFGTAIYMILVQFVFV